MIFKIKNPFADIKEVDLSEKELDYITAIVSGVERGKALKIMHMTPVELSKLYFKFGLTNKARIREMQMATIIGKSRIITKEICKRVADKYGFSECLEFGEA